MEAVFAPTGPAPGWASKPGSSGVIDPDPRQFGAFVSALAKRYSGHFVPDGETASGPEGRPLDGLERAQPLDLPAASISRRPPLLAAALPKALPGGSDGDPRPAARRPDPDRGDGADRRRAVRRPADLHAPDALPERRFRAAVALSPPGRERRCDRLVGASLSAGRTAAVRAGHQSPFRDHELAAHTRVDARRRRGGRRAAFGFPGLHHRVRHPELSGPQRGQP